MAPGPFSSEDAVAFSVEDWIKEMRLSERYAYEAYIVVLVDATAEDRSIAALKATEARSV
jgi:hypothetical protein